MDNAQETLGEAVFVTHDGLTAEGSGCLGSVADHVQIVEFRDSTGGIDHLPPRGNIAFFGSWVEIDRRETMLLGVLTREKDAMGRPGFFGVCQAVEPGDYTVLDYHALMRMFNEGHKHYRETFRQTRHADMIGFLEQDSAGDATLRPLSFEAGFSVFIRGDEPDEGAVVLRLWNLVESTRVTTLLWNVMDGPHPNLSESAARQEIARVAAARRPPPEEQFAASERSTAYCTGPENVGMTRSDREERFLKRGSVLRFPRPEGVSVELEDYFIALADFVVTERQAGSAPPIPPAKARPGEDGGLSSVFGRSSHGGARDFISDHLAGLLAGGLALILLAFVLGAVLTFSGSEDGQGLVPGFSTSGGTTDLISPPASNNAHRDAPYGIE